MILYSYVYWHACKSVNETFERGNILKYVYVMLDKNSYVLYYSLIYHLHTPQFSYWYTHTHTHTYIYIYIYIYIIVLLVTKLHTFLFSLFTYLYSLIFSSLSSISLFSVHVIHVILLCLYVLDCFYIYSHYYHHIYLPPNKLSAPDLLLFCKAMLMEYI